MAAYASLAGLPPENLLACYLCWALSLIQSTIMPHPLIPPVPLPSLWHLCTQAATLYRATCPHPPPCVSHELRAPLPLSPSCSDAVASSARARALIHVATLGNPFLFFDRLPLASTPVRGWPRPRRRPRRGRAALLQHQEPLMPQIRWPWHSPCQVLSSPMLQLYVSIVSGVLNVCSS
jgi:hypothetical protein